MGDSGEDSFDREAILARRRRFIALAITGLAGTGCKPDSPAIHPEPCLNMAIPEQAPGGEGPFVEEPGVPVGGSEGEDESQSEDEVEEEVIIEPAPQVCLNIIAPRPRPCLKRSRTS